MTRLIKTKEEIAKIKEGGLKLGSILSALAKMVKPGVTTDELEDYAVREIEAFGGRPSFKYFRPSPESEPFPTALCISIDNEIVHGPATPNRVLQNGQIVSLDIGMQYPAKDGYYTDTALTVPVGEIPDATKKLLAATEEALYAGIETVKPGNTLNDIGSAVEAVAKKGKFGIIRDLVGHGVGLDVHEEPQVPNYRIKNNEFPNVTLEVGMVIAIEPMFTLGDWRIKVADDNFTFVTADGSLSAHYEHTVAVTENGYDILTER